VDCDVERIETTKGKRKRRSFAWRCRRCKREFPYEAVLHLAGCGGNGTPHRLSRDELDEIEERTARGRDKYVKIERDDAGNYTGISYRR
jgi:rRNA maturation endonuclease Nob1